MLRPVQGNDWLSCQEFDREEDDVDDSHDFTDESVETSDEDELPFDDENSDVEYYNNFQR